MVVGGGVLFFGVGGGYFTSGFRLRVSVQQLIVASSDVRSFIINTVHSKFLVQVSNKYSYRSDKANTAIKLPPLFFPLSLAHKETQDM